MMKRRLSDTYRFPGYEPKEKVLGVFGDPRARIVRLERTGKKLPAAHAVPFSQHSMTVRSGVSETFLAATLEFTLKLRLGESSAKCARK
jgi:hypothetical protein